jgi:uncharacterized membrane protein YfcA
MDPLSLIQYIELGILGIAAGTYGAAVGIGGGFVVMPTLLLLYPKHNADLLTSVSLTAIFFNALSGSIAYARMRRIDYLSGLIFLLATIPGAILGAVNTSYIPRALFNLIFGILLSAVAVFLAVRPRAGTAVSKRSTSGRFTIERRIEESTGARHQYALSWPLGVGISAAVGYISSLLGLGGGIIHVPAMTYLFGFPVHIATATSHFILIFTAAAGAATHIVAGSYFPDLRLTAALVIGVVLGAQIGARISQKIQSDWIIRGLALALGIAGLRIVLMAK